MRRRGSEETTAQEGGVREPAQYQPPGKTAEMTVIGQGARLEGNLVSAGSLRIEGHVKGQITAEGDVIIAEGAEVTADVRANNVNIGGQYSGNVTAAGTLELESSAKVDGNVSCKSLIVNRGAMFSGQSIMNGGMPHEGDERKAVPSEKEE